MNIERTPVVAITGEYIDADNADTVFGKRWGSECIEVSKEQIDALQSGKYLAVDVQSEYVVYLRFQ